MQYDDVTTNPI